jgi:hypothetical protein
LPVWRRSRMIRSRSGRVRRPSTCCAACMQQSTRGQGLGFEGEVWNDRAVCFYCTWRSRAACLACFFCFRAPALPLPGPLGCFTGCRARGRTG